jgi:hypothetical protein
LTSSLNVELVYVILEGIKGIVRQEDLESFKNGFIATGGQDFNLKYEINKIEIRNPRQWEDAKQQDFVTNDFVGVETDFEILSSGS